MGVYDEILYLTLNCLKKNPRINTASCAYIVYTVYSNKPD